MDVSRRGGRSSTDTRRVSTELGGLARVDGSARFAFGDTAALASISGPIEVRIAAENPSSATLEVLHRPLSNIPGTQSKSLAASIRSALLPSLILTQNPRTLIQLVLQSLSPVRTGNFPDSLVASTINASTLALLNAGSVPMRGVVCAVAVGRTNTGALLVDPSEDEESSLDASGCFAFAFGRGAADTRCVWTNWRIFGGTTFAEDELRSSEQLACSGARTVWAEVHGLFAETADSNEENDEEMGTA
ncbi:exosome component Rrp46 [Mycena amicta]|nr:exosome component Rrp46 [Mycena amicta]